MSTLEKPPTYYNTILIVPQEGNPSSKYFAGMGELVDEASNTKERTILEHSVLHQTIFSEVETVSLHLLSPNYELDMDTSAVIYTKDQLTQLTPTTTHLAMEVPSHQNIFFKDAPFTNMKDKQCGKRLKWYTLDISGSIFFIPTSQCNH